MRGLRKVAEQCLLGAAAQNIKKIALLVARLKACLCVPDTRHGVLNRLATVFLTCLVRSGETYRTTCLA